MSVSFYIKNKKKFFSYQKVMKVREVIDLFKEYKLSFYNIDFHVNDPDGEKFYNTSIESWQENHNSILFGVEGKSARGFEFSYNSRKNSYVIREYTPASENDWIVALEFMKVLAEKLNSKIVSEQGDTFTFETINTFDYKSDIETGIKVISDILNKENEKAFNVDNIYGIKRVVSFNKEIIERIVNSSDEIKEFSNFCEDIQYINAYSAKQSFVEDRATKEKWGYYVLTENLRAVLPYKPSVEFFSMDYIKNEEVAFWKIFFCAYKVDENGEEGIDKIGESIYDDFIKKLPTDKYKFIDASYIVVEPLNRDEILEILK
ncbi:hypothetical protein RO03_03485 [Fusobacterium nucleatum subsp. nucleatum]|uniref:DUF4299 domain-containing protein n=1 Tax=Fusobacterium nucleatum subsp. nucleatum TaxID=76856 RepID=A0A0X3Y0V1_FUSNC|nr:DUF4299 domain-containing protein [Fusobacterium nucleatum]KUL98609.1 hypothetical protein RO03_03485 [Fusobacterium nucleatum subsp. nucleatum]